MEIKNDSECFQDLLITMKHPNYCKQVNLLHHSSMNYSVDEWEVIVTSCPLLKGQDVY